MKKIIAIALLSVAASFASASDLSLNYNTAPAVETAAPTAVTATPNSNPSPLESGAAKVGSLLGKLVGGTVNLGKAFVGGVGEGYSNGAAKAVPVPTEPAEAATKEQPAVAFGLFNPAALVAKLSKRPQDTAAAPVEEKSTVAVNTNY